jgi:subtilisin family serine protease
MVKKIVLLAAAMLVAGVLVAGLGFETPAEAQAQAPDLPDAVQTQDGSAAMAVAPRSPEADQMLREAEREGSIRVIVGLRTDFVPEGRLNRAAAADQRNGIERVGTGLRSELAGTGYRTLREYDTVPYIALDLPPQAFRAVQSSPRVTSIQEDVAVPATLEESAPVVQAPTMWTNGLTGTGKTIAILDTGVDRDHFFFTDRIIEEACFSSSGHCPNGTMTQTGTGAGVPCTYAPEGCEHGTHVAGIAAGNGNSAIFGVAPRANIMAVQVFSRFTGKACTDAGETEDPCTLTAVSDQIAGLEEVFEQAVEREDITVSAANMSLGGGMNTSSCDTDSRKAAIDNLRTISAATVISSGNSGFTNAVGAPACISSAVTVGSTTKPTPTAGESISDFSNMSSLVDLLAPGSSINSSIPGGGFEVKSGTSMAAPHVSGAWALMEQKDAGNTVSSIEQLLQMTGTSVTDNRAGGTVTKKRINIADAANVRPPNDGFSFPREIVGSTVTVSGANGGINGAATRESGEPDHLPANSVSPGENSVWYRWTAPVSGRVSINTCTSSFDTVLAAYTGGSTFPSLTQVASSDDACTAPNSRGSRISFDATAATTYRIAVAGFRADTRGEGTFTLALRYAPPPNDDFANAQLINDVPASVAGKTVGATREAGEPDHLPPAGGIRGERSVWYRWTAPTSGRVFVDTCTTNIDTVLAAYTGGSLGSLSRVASNKDGDGCAEGSRLSFNVASGTTYNIAVAGRSSGVEGSFTLKLNTQPPPKADYELFNSRESSVRGLFGVPPLADIGPGTNTFATATVDGDSRPVLKFPQGNGLQLFPTSGVIPSNVYTIVALFEFDSVSGFKRIVDFKNGTSDNGLYVQDGRLRFFPHTQRGPTPIPANTYVQVALTRNSAGTVTGYVNGVRQFTFTDTAGDAVISSNDALRFFRDNESGGANTEHSAGSAARIRLYDFALTPGEVSALDRQDTIPPRVTDTDPASNATGVARTAEVKATFSDPMRANSINTNTFKLRKVGTTDAIPATVTYIDAFRRAFLNPSADLERGATYVATVTGGARDLAGNPLDQDPTATGNQPKTWRFTVSP